MFSSSLLFPLRCHATRILQKRWVCESARLLHNRRECGVSLFCVERSMRNQRGIASHEVFRNSPTDGQKWKPVQLLPQFRISNDFVKSFSSTAESDHEVSHNTTTERNHEDYSQYRDEKLEPIVNTMKNYLNEKNDHAVIQLFIDNYDSCTHYNISFFKFVLCVWVILCVVGGVIVYG
jgi:hypothetical protein